MESANPRMGPAEVQHSADSFLHFSCGLVGKGNSEDALWRKPLLLNEMGYSTCNDTRFSGTRSRHDYQWPLAMLHSLQLLGI